MADGTIIIDSQLDTRKLRTQLKQQQKELEKVTGELNKSRTSLAEMEAQYAELTRSAREIAAETKMSDEETDAFITKNVKGAAELEAKMQQTASSIESATQRQEELKTKIEQTTASIKENEEAESDAAEEFERANRSLDKFTKKLIGLAKRVFVFTVIARALGSLKNYLDKVLKSNEAFRQSLANLKGSLLIAFQPILDVTIPIIESFINVLSRAAAMLAKLAQWIEGLFGKNSAAAAEALYDQAEATEAAGNVGVRDGGVFYHVVQQGGDDGLLVHLETQFAAGDKGDLHT